MWLLVVVVVVRAGWDEKKASTFEDPYAKALSGVNKPGAPAPVSTDGKAAPKFQVALSPQMQKKPAAKPELVTAADIGYADWKESKATAGTALRHSRLLSLTLRLRRYVLTCRFYCVCSQMRCAPTKWRTWTWPRRSCT
jgi:hypothetical protein